MSTPGVIVKTVDVRCSILTAFRVWTEHIDAWWPKRHSLSGDADTTVVLEQYVGGRLYERTPAGPEHDWGAVIAWEPPRHFAYEWYLGSGPDRPTLVDVHFIEQKDSTRVEVTHRGPELIGDLWLHRSSIYDGAWDNVLADYAAYISAALHKEEEQ